mmetsp:Transcript_20014/g.38161  ORF Transcript_20014/g.38161 Transcript_20014/m.38161 type:complete len:336 (+) Transcript_20014:159-1166(+)|eukprot:CAMPEP_0114233128 /NCGR_PEP_ID=MMETSP0058-20121206/4989_1 /TAXON_ID=36894 /ORGANISM="Pyramimonas parkeae, CCMP726" /LENGTH=335 /DNA_ID=CAMNT_0001344677 /DNA_START=130 /DNA_END=1137 /DNA_ORIENTATION=-
MNDLTEYERQRLAHIRRNQEFMARLGIQTKMQALEAVQLSTVPKTPKNKMDRVVRDDTRQVRRSGRLAGTVPEYTQAFIDQCGDDDEPSDGTPEGARKRPRLDVSEREREQKISDMLEDSRRWLRVSRDALLRVGTVPGQVPASADEWKLEAVRRWGPKVAALMHTDWELYVTSRLSRPPPPSPHDLLQEYYAHDTWQLLICCVLMSRVSSHDVKHNTIAAFFERYATPSHVLDADPNDVFTTIKPLGLFPTRFRSMVEVSQAFLQLPQFKVSLQSPFKLYGIGEFGYQSYLIFCCGDISVSPSDRVLKAFVAWQNKHAMIPSGAKSPKDAGIES